MAREASSRVGMLCWRRDRLELIDQRALPGCIGHVARNGAGILTDKIAVLSGAPASQ